MSLLQAVRSFSAEFNAVKTFWIAFSGGLDSQVLLSIYSKLRTEMHLDVRAIHINHGISPYANTWAIHCKNSCERLGIHYVERTIELNLQAGDSLEEIAREKRYAIFAEYLEEGDVLITAHHQDDQAETVLLQLMRGAGPKGLAAMPFSKPFGKGLQVRPLLSFPRSDLQQYATENALTWIEDESNQNLSFARNFIRHDIMPRLKSRWPAVATSLARSALHCAEHQRLLEAFSIEQYKEVQGSRDHTLSVAKLLQCSPEKQKLILRSWIHQFHYALPNTKVMDVILQTVLCAAWDRSPMVQWGEVTLRRYRDDIHLVPLAKILPNLDVLKTISVADVSIRFRQRGEKVEVKGRGRHTLKNLFQEWGVLPWERDTIPLIFIGDKLVAVPGYFLHEDYVDKGRVLL